MTKILFRIWLFAFLSVFCSAQTSIQFQLHDSQFGINQCTNDTITLQPWSIGYSGQLTLMPVQVIGLSDQTGQYTFTNLFGSPTAGFYHFNISVYNSSQRVQGNFWVQATNLGVLPEGIVDLVNGAPQYPPGTWAWSAQASDLRYAQSTNALNLQTITNIANAIAFIIGQNATNFTYGVGANDTNFVLLVGQNISNTITSGGGVSGTGITNFILTVGGNGTNYASTIGINLTNYANIIGSNGTNFSYSLAQNNTNFSFLLGGNETNYANVIGQNNTNNENRLANGITNNSQFINAVTNNQGLVSFGAILNGQWYIGTNPVNGVLILSNAPSATIAGTNQTLVISNLTIVGTASGGVFNNLVTNNGAYSFWVQGEELGLFNSSADTFVGIGGPFSASGADDTSIGNGAFPNLTSGSLNIAIGDGAGAAITTGNNNIDIGMSPLSNESGVTRIGSTSTTTTYIAGLLNANGTPLTNNNGAISTLAANQLVNSNQASGIALTVATGVSNQLAQTSQYVNANTNQFAPAANITFTTNAGIISIAASGGGSSTANAYLTNNPNALASLVAPNANIGISNLSSSTLTAGFGNSNNTTNWNTAIGIGNQYILNSGHASSSNSVAIGISNVITTVSGFGWTGESLLNSILEGFNNTNQAASFGTIINGQYNSLNSYSFELIGDGQFNELHGQYASILNGQANTIADVIQGNFYSVIVSGSTNSIGKNLTGGDPYGFNSILNGYNNEITNSIYGTILGGQFNYINAGGGGSPFSSAILNGNNNAILTLGSTAIGSTITNNQANDFVANDNSEPLNTQTNQAAYLWYQHGVYINTTNASTNIFNIGGGASFTAPVNVSGNNVVTNSNVSTGQFIPTSSGAATNLTVQGNTFAGGNQYQSITNSILGFTNGSYGVIGTYIAQSSTLWLNTNNPTFSVSTNGSTCLLISNATTIATAPAINGPWTIQSPYGGTTPTDYVGSTINEIGVLHTGPANFANLNAVSATVFNLSASNITGTINIAGNSATSTLATNSQAIGGMLATNFYTNGYAFRAYVNTFGQTNGNSLSVGQVGNPFIPFAYANDANDALQLFPTNVAIELTPGQSYWIDFTNRNFGGGYVAGFIQITNNHSLYFKADGAFVNEITIGAPDGIFYPYSSSSLYIHGGFWENDEQDSSIYAITIGDGNFVGGGAIVCDDMIGSFQTGLLGFLNSAMCCTNTETVTVNNCIATNCTGWFNKAFKGIHGFGAVESNLVCNFYNDSEVVTTNIHSYINDPNAPYYGYTCWGGTWNLANQTVSVQDTNCSSPIEYGGDAALYVGSNSVVNLYGNNTFIMSQPTAGTQTNFAIIVNAGVLNVYGTLNAPNGIYVTNNGAINYLNPVNQTVFGIVSTNWILGAKYSFPFPMEVNAKACLTVTGVSGESDLELEIVGSVTNQSAINTTVSTVAENYTNVISGFIPPNLTFDFTNRSSGSGDSATVSGGQYISY